MEKHYIINQSFIFNSAEQAMEFAKKLYQSSVENYEDFMIDIGELQPDACSPYDFNYIASLDPGDGVSFMKGKENPYYSQIKQFLFDK